MKSTLATISLVVLLLTSSASAQQFANRFFGFSREAPSTITLVSGEVLAGHFRAGKVKKGLYSMIVFEDTVKGEVRKIPSSDIVSMMLVPSALGRIAAASEATGSLRRFGNTDLNQLSVDHVFFRQARLSDKKGTMVLLQQVNPGFDSKLQVYDDPRAPETAGVKVHGLPLTGGLLKSYYIIRDGKAVLVAKSSYDRQFSELYGDCPALRAAFPTIKWADFADHVAFHEKACE